MDNDARVYTKKRRRRSHPSKSKDTILPYNTTFPPRYIAMTMNRKITCVYHLYSTLERIVLYTKTNCLCCCLVMGLRIEQAAAYSSGTEAPHTAQLPAVAPPTRANFITRSVYIMPHSLSKYPSFLSLSLLSELCNTQKCR
jgi:hypothetical protein